MKEAVKKEILYVLGEAVKIMEVKEAEDFEKLKVLSDHAVENVALHKDLDVISVTVLLYSLYKIVKGMKEEDYQLVVREMRTAKKFLEQDNFGGYNRLIKLLFKHVKETHGHIKEHLQDVMQAAKVKKGTVLLQKGLSIGQAAGLMGLSNWDLQQYAGHTTALEQHKEVMPAVRRLNNTLKIFSINS